MVKLVCLLMTVWMFAAPVFAANHKPVSPPPKADPELLEFIGSWQGSDGTWVDPMTFARIDPGKLAADKAPPVSKPSPPVKEPPPKQVEEQAQSL